MSIDSNPLSPPNALTWASLASLAAQTAAFPGSKIGFFASNILSKNIAGLSCFLEPVLWLNTAITYQRGGTLRPFIGRLAPVITMMVVTLVSSVAYQYFSLWAVKGIIAGMHAMFLLPLTATQAGGFLGIVSLQKTIHDTLTGPEETRRWCFTAEGQAAIKAAAAWAGVSSAIASIGCTLAGFSPIIATTVCCVTFAVISAVAVASFSAGNLSASHLLHKEDPDLRV